MYKSIPQQVLSRTFKSTQSASYNHITKPFTTFNQVSQFKTIPIQQQKLTFSTLHHKFQFPSSQYNQLKLNNYKQTILQHKDRHFSTAGGSKNKSNSKVSAEAEARYKQRKQNKEMLDEKMDENKLVQDLTEDYGEKIQAQIQSLEGRLTRLKANHNEKLEAVRQQNAQESAQMDPTHKDLIGQGRNVQFPSGFLMFGGLILFVSYTATIFYDFNLDFKEQQQEVEQSRGMIV